jgi:drug/metabolite transporter (DMT)-like permease
VLAIALALGAAAAWGTADFVAGAASRGYPAVGVLFFANLVSLVAAVGVLLVSGEPAPPVDTVALAGLTGLATTTGLLALYRALAVGTMGIVAPISGCGVIVPVLAGISAGDRISPVAAVGMSLAVAGVTFAVLGTGDERSRARTSYVAVALALLSAAAFGIDRVLTDAVAGTSVLWLLVISHLLAAGVLAVLFARHRDRSVTRRAQVEIVGAGILQVLATGLFAFATRGGNLSIVAVCGAMYPVFTALLARVVFHERLRPVQGFGVLATLSGIALIAGSTV